MHVIRIKLHLTFPSGINPHADRPCVIAEKKANIKQMMPSNDKMRKSVTLVLKVSKTQIKLHVLETMVAELRASIAQWNGRGNIFGLSCKLTDASKRNEKDQMVLLREQKKEKATCCTKKNLWRKSHYAQRHTYFELSCTHGFRNLSCVSWYLRPSISST